jgi:Rps23 Pro-64 3,4-dihydroxylase Tpa1-like proline 4-hydroxylase
MTPKQILDSFSETLIRDDRILNLQERSLITTLLQHAKAASGDSPETEEAVRKVIATAIGETIAHRAFAVLGGSVVDRILESSSLNEAAASRTSETLSTPKGPQTPGVARPIPGAPQHPGGPQTPGGARPSPTGPQTPGHPLRESPKPPSPGPQTPGTPLRDTPSGPQTPGHGVTKTVVSQATAVVERPERLAADCVVLDEFLAPRELAELTRFTLEHESEFQLSEVLSPNAEKGVVNYDHRRSRVITEIGHLQDMMLDRIKSVLPQILNKLHMEEFDIAGVEAQITASNDGDFFHFHSDNGADHVSSRHLTFVYFFHREPRQFEGGELCIHDSHLEAGEYVSEGSYQTIVPQQNQIVFFPCELMHEITPVKCPSRAFADSRFTLNGWLRQ